MRVPETPPLGIGRGLLRPRGRSRRACDDGVKLGLVRSFNQPGGKSLLTRALVAKLIAERRELMTCAFWTSAAF